MPQPIIVKGCASLCGGVTGVGCGELLPTHPVQPEPWELPVCGPSHLVFRISVPAPPPARQSWSECHYVDTRPMLHCSMFLKHAANLVFSVQVAAHSEMLRCECSLIGNDTPITVSRCIFCHVTKHITNAPICALNKTLCDSKDS